MLLPDLHADAEALLSFLRRVPDMKPEKSSCCGASTINQRDPRLYECRCCHRRFTFWTGTPFANSRHPESWAVYAEIRLNAVTPGKVCSLAGAHGAGSRRESVIKQLIGERWPRLPDCWNNRDSPGLRQTSNLRFFRLSVSTGVAGKPNIMKIA